MNAKLFNFNYVLAESQGLPLSGRCSERGLPGVLRDN